MYLFVKETILKCIQKDDINDQLEFSSQELKRLLFLKNSRYTYKNLSILLCQLHFYILQIIIFILIL